MKLNDLRLRVLGSVWNLGWDIQYPNAQYILPN